MAKTDVWMPIYWGDYLRDTAHLSQAEHGAYMLLIAHYWVRGMLEALPEQCQRIARAGTQAEREAVDRVLDEFFRLDAEAGVYRHARIDRERDKAVTNQKKAAEKGAKAAAARWDKQREKNAPSNAPSIAQAMPEQCPSPSPSTPEQVGDKSPTTPSAKSVRFRAEDIDLPAGINRAAWIEWCGYRRSRRKAVSEKAAAQQVGLLANYPEQLQAAMVQQSISNDWQGLFPLKGGANGLGSGAGGRGDQERPRSAVDRVRANIAREQAGGPAAAAGFDTAGVADDGQPVRAQVDQQLRGHGGRGERVGSVLEGDYSRSD